MEVYRTARTLDPALEAARYPYGRVRTIRGHRAGAAAARRDGLRPLDLRSLVEGP